MVFCGSTRETRETIEILGDLTVHFQINSGSQEIREEI